MQQTIEYHQLPWLVKVSCQGAVLILFVLVAQWVFGKRLHPRWRYWLWLLVVIRLALPGTISSSLSVFNLLDFPKASASFFGARSISSDQDSLVPLPVASAQQKKQGEASTLADAVAAPRSDSHLSLLLWLWLAGALSLTIFLLLNHYRLSRKVRLQRPLIDATVLNLLEDCKQQMGVRTPVSLVETDEIGSPALFGFVRPCLLLPIGLIQSFSLEELRYVFLHELGHIKRHDILIGWLVTGLQILHWFNPLVWLAFHRMRVDRELACDALALSFVQEKENQKYGHTIIKLLEGFGRSAWAPSLAGTIESKTQIKERIRMIAKFKKKKRGLVLAMALFASLGLVTLTDAQSETHQASKDLIGTWVLVGSPDNIGEAPAAGGRFKTFADVHWSITQADPKDGVVIFHHGGTYTFNGNEYVETIEYANESTKSLIEKTLKFTLTIEGDTFTQVGVGNPRKEVWRRVKSDSAKPHKLESNTLNGTWRGHEIGGKATGTASLVLKGENIEFHGANTNEWYKATFCAYDTTPKQLMIVITDCPVPQYVGMTGYAIYKIEGGVLTVAGNAPGNPVAPANFDAPGTRKFVFKQE